MSEERSATIRQAIAGVLREDALTALEISQRVGIPEREVASHLVHLERSLPHDGLALEVVPARCLACGFVFRRRDKKTKPSRCPECRSERLGLPRFRVK